MLDMIEDLPELDFGVGEEALNALFEADMCTTEAHGSPVPEPEKSPDIVLDEGIRTSLTVAVRLSVSLDWCSS
jgi:hypothetical protein